jgi:hypothetical protein
MELTNPVWYCLPMTASVLKETRLKHSLSSDARAGLNYMLILTSTTYLEAVMERGLAEIVQMLPKSAAYQFRPVEGNGPYQNQP